MSFGARRLVVLFALSVALLNGCASMSGKDPVQAFVVGLEPLEGQGLELRMSAKLRIQNPNDAPIEFTGVAIQLDLQGKRFATGVSKTTGTVPGFGEAIIDVPISISLFRIANQFLSAAKGDFSGKVAYSMNGKLSGAKGTMRFKSQGELELPTGEPQRTTEL